LHIVHHHEKHHCGADEKFSLQLLGHEVHQQRRAAVVANETGEARQRRPDPPLARDTPAGFWRRASPLQLSRGKPTPIAPTNSNNQPLFSSPKHSVPNAMPTSAPGRMMHRLGQWNDPAKRRRPMTSIAHRIGSMMPAASSGAMTSDSSGTARPPIAPPKPDLEIPVIRIAGIASA